MIVARQLRDKNIIEYILYMWHVEDMIRANKLNVQEIDKNIIAQYKYDDNTIIEVREWWDNLAEMMRLEKKEETGHLQVNINTVNDVHQLHLKLIRHSNEITYTHAYQTAVPMIKEFELKSAAPYDNDIELCITAIYSAYLLKIQNKALTPATEKAIQSFSKFLSVLALKYKLYNEGELDLD